MTRPEDIPEDVWEMARDEAYTSGQVEPIARSLLAYGQSRADAATERAARVCEEKAKEFLSPEYASGQPMSSFAERFACGECATAIRSQK